MRTLSPEHLWESLPATFAAVGARVETVGTRSWRAFPSIIPTAVIVRATQDFLCFSANVGEVQTEQWWDLLSANKELHGHAKFALGPSTRLSLQAELPLAGRGELARGIQSVLDGFAQGVAFVTGRPASVGAVKAATPEACDEDDLTELTSASGWPASVRSDGSLRFVLETHRGGAVAVLRRESASIRIDTDLGIWDALSPVSRLALTERLLLVSGLVRMARPTLAGEDDTITARLEVCFDAFPTGMEVNHALSALSVGYDLCAAEVGLFEDETVAQEFLGARGGPREVRRKQHA